VGRRARSQSFPPRSGFVQVDFELFSRHDACDRRGSPEPHAAGRELGLISWSIPPSFVVSHNMSMINTTSNWLCFCSFPSSPVSSLRIHWPLTTGYCSRAMGHYPLASRPAPHAALRWDQRGQVMRKPSPAGISVTDRRIAKDRTGPDLDEHPPILIMSPNQAIPADKSNNSSSSRSPPINR
jgi:hypothetical protein